MFDIRHLLQRARGSVHAALAAVLMLAATCVPAQTVTYFHNDASGTPLLATDAAGNVVWKETYRPYGERQNNPPAEANNRIGFTGKPFDPTTGLSYMGARYYDPVLGRFLGVDPEAVSPENLHSFNRYAYANNNPYRYIDPDGRAPVDRLERVGGGRARPGSAEQVLERGMDGRVVPQDIGRSRSTLQEMRTAQQAEGGAAEAAKATTGLGKFAGESIPARSAARDFTSAERAEVNGIGSKTGCQTCGTTNPGTKSGNFVPDHQPPSALNVKGESQRLYPQCINCSREQGLEIARQLRQGGQ